MLNIAVFTYDFPHKKTQDFIMALLANNIKIKCVIAAPRVELKNKNSLKRIKVKNRPLFETTEICSNFGIPYYVAPHNSEECISLLTENKIDLGIIAGARILKENVIEAVNKGILNLHPGWIPDVRGLDAVKWAVYNQLPLGVTAHYIDKRVDAGKILDRRGVNVDNDDTFFDISQKIDNLEIELMISTLKKIFLGREEIIECVFDKPYNTVMPKEKEDELDEKLKIYKAKVENGIYL